MIYFLILVLFIFSGILLLINWLSTSKNKRYHLIFDIMLAGLNLFLLLPAFAFFRLSADDLAGFGFTGLESANFSAMGWVLAGMAIWGIGVSIGPVRRLIAHILPIDPASPVHTFALVLTGFLVGNTFLTLAIGGLEVLAETAVSITIYDVIFQQLAFVILAFLGVGILIRRNGNSLLKRLGLEKPTVKQLRIGVRWIIVLVIIQAVVGGIWSTTNPEQSELVNNVSEALLGEFDSIGEWFILALGAGVGEEILFRGALQPILGLGFTSVLFALVHVQYGFSIVTLTVLFIGFVLGIIRRQTNTTVAIFVHFGYNFTLGLLSLLAPYLEQFAN